MSTQELAGAVPPPDHPALARVEAKIDALAAELRRVTVGQMNGTRYEPGFAQTQQDHERRISELEKGRGWFKERALGVLVAVLTAIATTWGVTHTIGGKP